MNPSPVTNLTEVRVRKLWVLACLGLSACASTGTKSVDYVGEERVLSRIDDMSSRPDWLKESDVFKVEGGKVQSLGSTVIPADHNVSSAYRIAANSAKGQIASAIEARLDFIFQQAVENGRFHLAEPGNFSDRSHRSVSDVMFS
jgi:hypothetical protein